MVIIDKIQELVNYMYLIICIGSPIKLVAILISSLEEDNKEPYKKKAKNVLAFFVIAISLTGIFDLVISYIGSL